MKNLLKLILFSILSASAISCLALDNGFYSDGSLSLDHPDIYVALPSQSGGGYQFNDYFGLEGGYLEYPNGPTDAGMSDSNSHIAHVVAKGSIPLNERMNVYAKAGAAQVSSQVITAMNFPTTPGNTLNSHSTILPYVGTGIGYGLNQQVDFDFQLSEMPLSGEKISAMHSAMAGFSFKF